jgi:4-azaleucine resistance transporter AzlC
MFDRAEFKRGLIDIGPMTLAYVPIATLWGTVAAAHGLSPLEAVLMSAGVYSGTAQFVVMDLWAGATPLIMLVLTVATVGLRHVLMSASLARHIGHFSKGQASFLLFWMTDEAWAMLERRAQAHVLTPSYFMGVAMPLWPNWFLFSGIGAALGKALGNTSTYGLDFAFPAMFIVVLAGFWKGRGTAGILLGSAVCAVTAKLLLPGAWYILAGAVGGIGVALASYKPESPNEH